MQPLELILSKLENVKKHNGYFMASCPAHEDKNPSLSVSEGKDGKALLFCHAGCSTKDICSSINISESGLFPDNGHKSSEPIATYDYVDEDGKLLYQTVRFFPKDFKQRRPDGSGGWIWNLKGIDLVLYNLQAVREAVKANETIYIVEGEKDANNLISLGLTATTSPLGAGKWRDSYSKSLMDAKVAILPDNDPAGKEHAQTVAKSLQGKAASIKIINLPGLKEKQDVTDWLNAGHTKEDLLKLVVEDHKEPFALGLEEFMAGSSEIEWLWDGILAKPSLGILAAKPKFGKTLLSFNLAIAASLGSDYLGRKVEQTNVLIIQLEDPPVIIRNRFAKMGVGDEDRIFIRAGLPMSPQDWKLLSDFIIENEIGLTVIDPFIFAFSGNEQDATATGIFLKQIRELIFATDCSVLLVHHHRKSQGEHGDAIRGSSAILGAVDVALELVREDEDDPKATLKVTSRFDCVEPEIISLDADILTWQSNGKASDYKKSKRENEIIEALQDGGEMTIPELEDTLDVRAPNFRRDLKSLVDSRIINERKEPTGKRPKLLYSVSEYSTISGIKNEYSTMVKNDSLASSNTILGINDEFSHPRVDKNVENENSSNSWQCNTCQSSDYWIGESGLKVCSICHPKPEAVNV